MGNKKIPHTYVIVFSIILIAAALTWFIPGGEFAREKVTVNGVEREVIINNSFAYTESMPQTWQVFTALFQGFVNTSEIIVFILIIGGAFWILTESKAIDTGILSFLNFTKTLKHARLLNFFGVENIILVLIMLVFSIFGAVFGMSEETIAFTIIFVPLAISLGYDSIVGVSMCFVAAALGFAGAMLNPFTIGIAQGLAHLPLFSGIEYRLFMWVVINVVGFAYILWYAGKVKKNPQSSIMYELDEHWRKSENSKISVETAKSGRNAWFVYAFLVIGLLVFAWLYPNTRLSVGQSAYKFPAMPAIAVLFAFTAFFSLRKSIHSFVLNLLSYTIILLIVGVMGYSWYVKEIAGLFMGLGLFTGFAMNYSPNQITQYFIAGVKDITSAALVVGLAGGIIVVLNEGQVIDTLLFYMSQAMNGFGQIATVSLMYTFTTMLNILIPSGSGKAALLIPMMSQFSDLVGISRQTLIVAFQLGDGFTNMITPTSGVLIGVLSVARIPFEKWFKWVLPFMIILVLLGFLLLIPATTMQLNGF